MSTCKRGSIQRAAGGASAAGAVVVNGLPRASGKADAEYARRRWALRDQRPAYDRMRKWARKRQAGWHRRKYSHPVPAVMLRQDFLFFQGGIFMKQFMKLTKRWRPYCEENR